MKSTVAFDIDDVLADFELSWCDRFGFQNRHLYSLSERLETDTVSIEASKAFVANPYHYQDLALRRDGLEFLLSFIEHDYLVVLLTSRPISTKTITKNWLNHNRVPYFTIDFVQDKAKRATELGVSILVDDNPNVLEACKGYPLNPICWRREWNRHWFPQVWMEDGEFVIQKWNETEPIERYWNE